MIELLVAVIVSALVMTIASRIFLSGHHEFLARVFESERLNQAVRIKASIRRELEGEILKCASGRLSVQGDSAETEVTQSLKKRYAMVESVLFSCFEIDRDLGVIREWKSGFQPEWIEYRVVLKGSAGQDTYHGSFMR